MFSATMNSRRLSMYYSRLSFTPFRSHHWTTLTDPFLTNRLKLQAIHRFTSTAAAVEDITAIGDGKISKSLKKFLTDEITGKDKLKNEKLAVSEPKLAGAISKKLALNVVSDSSVNDLYRGIRTQIASLLGDIDPKDISTMELGLSHSVSRLVLLSEKISRERFFFGKAR